MTASPDIVIYGVLLVAYLGILALTERSAGRYVCGTTKTRSETRIFVIADTARPRRAPQPIARPMLRPARLRRAA